MPHPVACQCGQQFMAEDHLAGQQVACPSCGAALFIQAAPANVQPPTTDQSPFAHGQTALRPPANVPHQVNVPAPTNPIVGLLQYAGAKLLVIGVLFLISMPVLWFMLRPGDDFKYHLFGATEREFGSAPIEHNDHVRANAPVDLESVYVVEAGIFTRTKQYFFQLEGQNQSNLFFFVGEGPLHSRLARLEGGDLAGADEPITLSGRAHQSDVGFTDPFVTCYDRDDIYFEDYIEEQLHGDADEGTWLMVVVGEEPGSAFSDSNGAIFLFGAAISLGAAVVIGAVVFFRSKQTKSQT